MSHFGLLAEYETPQELTQAAKKVRDAGFKKWDCHTPFPVHGLDSAMGLGSPKLPWVVMGAGAAGAALAVGLQWWTNAVDYAVVVSGKPLWSIPANIPIVFELTVLLSALTAFACLFVFNNLPKFYHPTFRSQRFKRVTTDKFFIVVEAADPQFDSQKTHALLESTGADHIETLED